MSLTELKTLARLETRQKNVNKKLRDIVKEETTKPADESYLVEDEDEDNAPSQLQIPTYQELQDDLTEEQATEIYQFVNQNIMPEKEAEIQKEFNQKNPVRTYSSHLFENVTYTYPVPEISSAYKFELVNNLPPAQRNEARDMIDQENDRIRHFNDTAQEYDKQRNDEYRNYYDSKFDDEIRNQLNSFIKKQMIDIRNLNLGNTRTERLPNETDDQYIDRLDSITMSLPDSEEIVSLRKQKEKNKLKKNLQKIMKFSDAELVINDTSFMTDENIALLNKIFPKFNKDIRETFKSVDIPTFKSFTISYLAKVKRKELSGGSEKELDSSSRFIRLDDPADIEDFRSQEEDELDLRSIGLHPFKFGDVYDNGDEEEAEAEYMSRFNPLYAPPTSRGDYSQLLGTQELRAMEAEPIEAEAFLSPTIAQATPAKLTREGRKAQYTDYLKQKDFSVESLRKKIAEEASKDTELASYFKGIQMKKQGKSGRRVNRSKQEIITSLVSKFGEINDDFKLEPQQYGFGLKQKKQEKRKQRTFYGKGIPNKEEEEKYYSFGKFLIDNDRLNQNIVRVVYESTGINHPKIKNTLVSEDFKDLLMDIIDKKKFNERAFKRLTKEEQAFMKSILEKSGVSRILKIKDLDDDDDKALTNKLLVIQGELEIGNTSPLLRKEASEIILHFIQKGKITQANGYKMLYSLTN